MTDKEKLDELEMELTRLHNKQVGLLSEYTKAIKADDGTLKDQIEEQYNSLHWRIKALNKRITLLKNQSWEL